MLKKEPKYRKTLTEKQLRLLKLIYKFRFVSVPLLAEVLGRNKSSVYENLYVLVGQGYVEKRYDGSFRLAHIPAIYCLDTKGIKLLRNEEHKLSDMALRNMYKNKRMNLEYINKCLQALEIFSTFKRHYSDTFSIFSRFELSDYDFFPRPLPDFYLRRVGSKEDEVNEFMVSILEKSVPYFVHIKKMRTYQTHEEEEGWEGDYPCVLLIAPTDAIEKRLRKTIENTSQDFEFYTTTVDRLIATDREPAVWAEAFEEDELISLNDMER